MRTAIVIPTYNAGAGFKLLLEEISRQSLLPAFRLAIDSGSSDGTADTAKAFGWQVEVIKKAEFSHGGTRQKALEMLPEQAEIVIFMTQDVRLGDVYALERLTAAFASPDIAAAYGRQLPHEGASIYAAVDREFNYPPASRIKSREDSRELGIKTAFLSDSFAAYRAADLKRTGGFPEVDICEDMYAAGRLLLAGRRIAYVAEAEVRHSHEPEVMAIWHRYRAMGRFQRENPWIRESFGGAGGEGMKLAGYQIGRVMMEKGIAGVIKILALDILKLAAYKLC